ncbi:hypothetical protein M5585_18055 [Serratia ureilytica]
MLIDRFPQQELNVSLPSLTQELLQPFSPIRHWRKRCCRSPSSRTTVRMTWRICTGSGRTAAGSASWKAATGAFSVRRCCCTTPSRWKRIRRSAIWPHAWRRSKPR